MSSISSLVAQLTLMLDKSMIVFYSRPFLFQTSSLTVSQMHVVVFSESLFHVGSLPCPTDMECFFICRTLSVGPMLVP